MYELSLFTGAGGGILGTALLGWRPVGYVEKDEYCQQILAHRIADGVIPNAPIFGDINTFLSEGYAAAYHGLVDVITAGFPCQPFSVAGRRTGKEDERNLWPQTLRCIRAIRPRYAFMENVPGLLSSGYFGTITGQMAESGYDIRWRVLSAADLGAPHLRKRLWIVAYPTGQQEGAARQPWQEDGSHPTLADTDKSRRQRQLRREPPGQPQNSSALSDTDSHHQFWWAKHEQMGRQRRQEEARETDSQGRAPWPPEPDIRRVAYGVANRVDRLKALGNGQVPRVVAAAWRLLTADLEGAN